MKVVSFSLWGTIPKYTVGAVRNAELVQTVYPGWVARFYCASSVPHDNLVRLEHLGSQVVQMRDAGDWKAALWRFLPAGDPQVETLIARDTDSRLNARERAAVQAWLASNRDFHVMRDHPHHCFPVLGGMWGVRNGLLSNIRELIDAFPSADRYGIDQEFLATVIAPIARPRWLEHDEYFVRKRFPTCRRGRQFVGQPFDEHDRVLVDGPSWWERQKWRAQRWNVPASEPRPQ